MLSEFPAGGADGGSLRAPAPIWIDLFDPTDDEKARIESEHGIRVPTRANLEEIESSSRLRAQDGILYMSMPLVTHDESGEPFPSPVGFVLSSKLLVTVRYSELQTFRSVRQRLEKEQKIPGSPETFAALLEEMVDFGADQLENIGSGLTNVSKQVFRTKASERPGNSQINKASRQMLMSVGIAGEHLSHIRETILGLQRIITFTSESGQEWIKPEICGRLKTARHDLLSLSHFETHLSGKVQFLLDAILGLLNTEQNEIFKVLTIVSVVGIPPTFIASMYGMNFHNMPEYGWSWGYQWGLGLIVVSTLVPVIWFKIRGWW